MSHVLVRIEVEDFDTFYSGFESRGYPLREKHGSRRSQIFRHAGNPEMEGILGDPEVRESMKKGGTIGPPKITYLDRVGELEA